MLKEQIMTDRANSQEVGYSICKELTYFGTIILEVFEEVFVICWMGVIGNYSWKTRNFDKLL